MRAIFFFFPYNIRVADFVIYVCESRLTNMQDIPQVVIDGDWTVVNEYSGAE